MSLLISGFNLLCYDWNARLLDYSHVSAHVLGFCWDIWIRLALEILNWLSYLDYVCSFRNKLCLSALFDIILRILQCLLLVGCFHNDMLDYVARCNNVIICLGCSLQPYGHLIELLAATVLCWIRLFAIINIIWILMFDLWYCLPL